MGSLFSSLASTKRPSSDDHLPSELLDLVVAWQQRYDDLPPEPIFAVPSYDDLPPEILDLVIERLPDPADHARARTVCRSWHSAMRPHGPQRWRLPSTMSAMRRLCLLLQNVDLVGSTNDWLAICVCVGEDRKYPRHNRFYNKGSVPLAELEAVVSHHKSKYLMHNPFFNETVPLAELEAVISHHKSEIRKFLMQSCVDDLIAVITNNYTHAFMVIRPGKGVWLPQPWERPYVDIIDFAFLGGKLYCITTAEDLIPFELELDADGRPVVSMGRRLIKQPQDYDGHDVWPADEEQVAAAPNEEIPNAINLLNDSTYYWPSNGPDYNDINKTSRHLIESCGKLLLVRHHQQMRQDCEPGALYFTRGVEVFEADTDTGAWTPVTGGLGGGRALFISMNFSKSVAAPYGEVEEDAIYFMATGEVFDLKSGTCSPSPLCSYLVRPTWLFHPELVL